MSQHKQKTVKTKCKIFGIECTYSADTGYRERRKDEKNGADAKNKVQSSQLTTLKGATAFLIMVSARQTYVVTATNTNSLQRRTTLRRWSCRYLISRGTTKGCKNLIPQQND